MWEVAKAFCGHGSNSCSVQERCRNVLWLRKHQLQRLEALQEPGAFCGFGSISCSVQERCRSVLWLRKHQLQRPGALQERSVATETTVAASRSVVAAYCGFGNISCIVRERYRSVLWLQKHQLQRQGALQEHSVAPEASVAASGSVAGAFCGSGIWKHQLQRSGALQGLLQRPGTLRRQDQMLLQGSVTWIGAKGSYRNRGSGDPNVERSARQRRPLGPRPWAPGTPLKYSISQLTNDFSPSKWRPGPRAPILWETWAASNISAPGPKAPEAC